MPSLEGMKVNTENKINFPSINFDEDYIKFNTELGMNLDTNFIKWELTSMKIYLTPVS